MSVKISTLLTKVDSLQNRENASIIMDFYNHMCEKGSSENHKINNLKVVIDYAKYLGDELFYNVNKKSQVTSFLNSKVKDTSTDPEKRWITTWNHFLNRMNLFFRWLYNMHKLSVDGNDNNDDAYLNERSFEDWTTPEFIRIKQKSTKRLSPYSENEIWERDELLTILKYEPYKRNKAIISLMWDLDARPHEITLLKIKHIRLRENYGEGEIPYQAKTGSGAILLMCSFPYVRDWLNEHPFKNEPDARLICNLFNGAPINPKTLWNLMNQLKQRIIRLLEIGEIKDRTEREKLEYLLKTKKWNPYCIRHSAITADSDHLTEYALKKKVRWSMNSKQGSRYIKTRMGNDLKNKILEYNGIVVDSAKKQKPSILNCPRCELTNALENKYCSQCSYPLTPEAFDQIKQSEEQRLMEMEKRYTEKIENLTQDMENKFQQLTVKVNVEKLRNAERYAKQ